jgi:hypothetical protein
MLSDLIAAEAEQIERDRIMAVAADTLVSGMQKDQISVHKRAIDCYIGSRSARDLRDE